MKISKQLLLIATLGLCIPFNASAAHRFTHETAIIESYMPILRNQPTIGAEKVVQWLDKKLQKQSLKNDDAITIASILNANASINTKVAEISKMIIAKEAEKARKAQIASQQKRKNIAETAFICGTFILFGGIILLDAIVNPYPKCQACRYGDFFYVDGNPCRYIHTCYRPRKHMHYHHCPSSRVHVHFNV